MTAHFALLHSPHVLVVGDRLLTKRFRDENRAWDEYANKTIIVLARNGNVVVSYALLAHVDGLPTDMWLLDLITERGWAPPGRGGPRPLMELGPPRLDLTVGMIRTRIIDGIRNKFPPNSTNSKYGIEVMIAGWTWKRRLRNGRRRMTTVGGFITHETVTTEPGFESFPRQYAAVTGRGNHRTDGSIGALRKERPHLSAAFDGTGTVYEDEFESAMIADIREAADVSNSTIGREYISVFLPSYGDTPYVKYVRDPSKAAAENTFWPAIVDWEGGILNPSTANCASHGTSVFGMRFLVEPPCPPNSRQWMSAQERRGIHE